MSEFWKRKMRTYFSMFDVDKDGVISRDDWIWMAIPRVQYAKQEFAEPLKTQFVNLWEHFMQNIEVADKSKLTLEMFIKVLEKLRYDPVLRRHYHGLVTDLFYMTDTNGDGFIQHDEFERMIAQCGVKDTLYTTESFKAIDVNGDGKLSLQELINSLLQFLFSDDAKDPIQHFFGPLLD